MVEIDNAEDVMKENFVDTTAERGPALERLLDDVATTFDRLCVVRDRLGSCGDRLVGPQPEAVTKDGPAPGAGGYEGRLEIVSEQLASVTSQLDLLLQRIERVV